MTMILIIHFFFCVALSRDGCYKVRFTLNTAVIEDSYQGEFIVVGVERAGVYFCKRGFIYSGWLPGDKRKKMLFGNRNFKRFSRARHMLLPHKSASVVGRILDARGSIPFTIRSMAVVVPAKINQALFLFQLSSRYLVVSCQAFSNIVKTETKSFLYSSRLGDK